jgi:hypothetical protein
VLVCGAIVIWAVASPLSRDGSGLSSVSWPGLLIPTLVAALLAGTSEGALLRARRRTLSIAALVLLSLPALLASLFYVGQWPGDSSNSGTDPALAIAAFAAWAIFTAISVLLALGLCAIERPSNVQRSRTPTE